MMIATLPALASEEITTVAKAFASFTWSKAAQQRQKSEPISSQLNGRNVRQPRRAKDQEPTTSLRQSSRSELPQQPAPQRMGAVRV